MVNATPRPLYIWEKHGKIRTGAWVGPTGAEKLAPNEVRTVNGATLSESLYRLSYRGPQSETIIIIIVIIIQLT